MYNRIILIGTIAKRPEEMYAVDGRRFVSLLLTVPLPPTYWGEVNDLRVGQEFTRGQRSFW
ncbi:MAG TPA: hypothetical protein VL461_04085 [Dictyobacter sp.]|nr:hypothetical protein [Dictyobacter sp.]